MNQTNVTDILFEREPGADELREAAACAFGVRPAEVAVGRLQDVNVVTPGLQVVIQRQPEDMPGDFPAWYGLTVTERLLDRADSALNAVARQLGLVALSDARGQDEMMLHLPDGSGLVIDLPQGEDDSFHLAPAQKHVIAAARRNAANPDSQSGTGDAKRAIVR
jgi:hypothetical protein